MELLRLTAIWETAMLQTNVTPTGGGVTDVCTKMDLSPNL